jgi:hypothetical protein
VVESQQHQVFDIVPTHQHQPASGIDRGNLDHAQASRPSGTVGSHAAEAEPPESPGGEHDQNDHEHQGQREAQICL